MQYFNKEWINRWLDDMYTLLKWRNMGLLSRKLQNPGLQKILNKRELKVMEYSRLDLENFSNHQYGKDLNDFRGINAVDNPNLQCNRVDPINPSPEWRKRKVLH